VWAKAVEAVTLPTTACFWLCHGQKKSERRTTAKLGEGSFDSSFRSALVIVKFDGGGGVGVSTMECVGLLFRETINGLGGDHGSQSGRVSVGCGDPSVGLPPRRFWSEREPAGCVFRIVCAPGSPAAGFLRCGV